MAPAASSLRPICNIDVQDKIITVQHPCHMSLSAAKLQAVEQQNHNRYTLTARIQTVKRILRIHAAFYEKYPLVLERLKSVVLQFWHTAQISSTLVPEIGSAIKRDLTPPVTNMFLMRTCAAISESVF